MAKYLNFQNTLILFFLLIIGYLLFQNNKRQKELITTKVDGKKYELVKHNVDTIVVKNTYTILKQTNDIYHDNIIYDTTFINNPIDTLSVLKQFYSKVVYKDTLRLKDSLGYITLLDTVNQNRIVSRRWDVNTNKYTVNNTIYLKELPRNQLYFGLNAELNKANLINGVGLGFIFKNKKDKIYLVNGGVNSNMTPYINGGFYWKLQFRK